MTEPQDNIKFRVIFEGKVKKGADLGKVKARMISLFKIEGALVERIFKESPAVIQRNLEQDRARLYKETFEKSGALCRIETDPSGTLD